MGLPKFYLNHADETMSGPSCLEFNDTLLTAKKGKTHFIEVQANNPTNHIVLSEDSVRTIPTGTVCNRNISKIERGNR